MSFFANNMISKGLQKGIVAAALMFGWLGGLANAAPISPESIRSAQVEAPIEKTQVVVHHRRPVAVHHHRRPVVVHHHHPARWWFIIAPVTSTAGGAMAAAFAAGADGGKMDFTRKTRAGVGPGFFL
jgi:hypothetical protein